jgi:hypothetical protein
MDQTLTIGEAFEAMRVFLTRFNEREPADRRETLELLLVWTEVQPDGVTHDPAQWEDWLEAVELVRGSTA